MTEATQSGADLNVSSAASAIERLLDAGSQPSSSPQDKPNSSMKASQPSDDEHKRQTEEIVEDKAVSAETDNEPEDLEPQTIEDNVSPDSETDAEFELPSHIDQLAEAMGIDPNALLNVKIKTKIDGQDGEVTLAELQKSYQLQGHVNNKSMELAEQRKAFESQLQQQQSLLQQKVTELDDVAKLLGDEFFREFNSVNWDELRSYNPAEFAAKRQEFADRQVLMQQAFDKIAAEKATLQEKQMQEYHTLRSQVEKEQSELLINKIPEWANEEKRKAGQKELAKYLNSHGYSNDDLKNVLDHRQIVIAHKAMLYDNLAKSKVEVLNKAKTLPKFMKSSTVKSKADIRAEKTNLKLNKLKKSGSVQDAASALLDLM